MYSELILILSSEDDVHVADEDAFYSMKSGNLAHTLTRNIPNGSTLFPFILIK